MRAATIILTILLFSQLSFAQSTNLNLHKGIAVEGYDVVSYFLKNEAEKGDKKFTSNYKGATYYFSSKTHLEKFKAQPSKYVPQYGGWCAYAMGLDGSKVEIDPKTYKILNGKLYLFYNKYFTNTLDDWNKDEVNLKKKADGYWKKIEN